MRKTCTLIALWFLMWTYGLVQASSPVVAPIKTDVSRATTVADNTWRTYESSQSSTVQNYALGNPLPLGKPFTVTTHVKLDNVNDNSSVDNPNTASEIWLAGFTGGAIDTPTAVAITCKLETSGWFPTWRLYVRSDAGLIPSGQSLLLLGPISAPENGSEYTTILSYNPQNGVLSVRVKDGLSGQALYADNLELNPYSGALYPGVGAQYLLGKQSPRLNIKEISTQPYFVPIGAHSKMVTRTSAGEQFIDMYALDRRDEWALDLSLPAQPLENEIRLVRDDGLSKLVCLRINNATGNQVIGIPAVAIPAGKADFVLEYSANGVTWELDRFHQRVGNVDIKLGPLNLTRGSSGESEITSWVKVSSDGAIQPFDINVRYVINVPGRSTPLNEQWKKSSGMVAVHVENLGVASNTLPVRIPLGTMAEYLNDKEAFVTVTAATELEIPVKVEGTDRAVVGNRVPVFPKVGEYTVLRGDFHSHSTESDGKLTPHDRIWESYMYGYDTLALTDHRTINGYVSSGDYAQNLGLTLVRGFETGIEGKQHLVVLGTDDAYQMRDEHNWSRQPNKPQVYYQDQIRDVIAHNGYVIYAHPGGTWVPPGPYSHPDGVYGFTDEIQWMLSQGYIDGVESRGNLEAPRRDAAYRWALEYGLTLVDSSDVHEARNFSNANQAPVTLVLAKDNTPTGVLDALRNERTLIWRDGLLRGKDTWLKPFIDAMLDFKLTERNGEPCLQITNHGALNLFGTVQIDEQPGRLMVMFPMSSVYLPCNKEAKNISIKWGNVQNKPGQPLVTTHIVD